MRSRLAAIAALVTVLATVALVRRKQRGERLALTRSEALRMDAIAAALDRCLFGEGAPRHLSAPALLSRARRIALHPDTASSWPMACASHARELLDAARVVAPTSRSPRVQSAAASLLRALTDPHLPSALMAFREGSSAATAFPWVSPALEIRRALPLPGPSQGSTLGHGSPWPRLQVLASAAGDLLPVSIAPGSTVAGWNAAAGTLSVLFVEPSRARVFCQTHDRGTTITCRRFDASLDAPTWLVGNDGPEALLLRAHPSPRLVSVDLPDVPVFNLPRPLAASLPARVAGDLLYTVTEHMGRAFLTRCARGASCVFTPLASPPRRESVMLSTGRARWWIGVSGPETAPTLDARRVDDSENATETVRVRALAATGAILTSCHAHGVAYVAVTDGALAHIVAVEGEGPPHVLGSFEGIPPPVDLTCDAHGATLVGATRAQGCERDGSCPPALPLHGFQRVVRMGGELVAVWTTRDGGEGLRARHGTAETFARARAWAVDDDATHGGVSASDLWLFPVDDRLVLFASAATTTVLWSGDHGERWQSAREPVALRPMPLGRIR